MIIEVCEGIAGAAERTYPLMGFSFWHHQVSRFLGGNTLGCNAVIVYKGESVVISGDVFPDTRYFRPQYIGIEKSRRFPDGLRRDLEPYTKPHEIANIIREMVP